AGPMRLDAVYLSMDRTFAKRVPRANGALRAVYAYEDGSAHTYSAAASRGLRRIYYLPIGYWRAVHAIYQEEKEREPEWASTLSGILDSPAKLARKDEELKQADAVIVASSFTKQTLNAAPCQQKPVYVIPYGAPL